jgi:peptidoglycan/xylan/chitin deacetylase (PgdA/CDA1 family)
MVQEFLKLEKKYGIPATYNIVGKLFQEQPDLIQWIIKEDQDIGFHSYNHQADWKPEYYSDEIDLCRNVSRLPLGYRSPRSQVNQKALERLWEKGFLWNAELDRHNEPYFIYGGLVRLPIGTDDWLLSTEAINTGEWIQQFYKLLEKRTYFALGTHDFVVSFAPEERLNALEQIFRIAIENKALLVNFSEAADLFRRAALSRYYSASAKMWNRSTKPLYRTKRFQELLKDETLKLARPVIADLGSGGAVLSSPLKDYATRIYCVDNAPGMVNDIDTNNCIEALSGDVTDTNLPDSSIDLVICGRIIEYLFWPDSLADEIKRIGKIGATFFVTFPAFRINSYVNKGAPPDRIRHYFTPDEIKQWASQIGPGHLIGIQYEGSEPDTPEKEHQYRELEKNPPSNAYPTNWVYIVTIQKKDIKRSHKRTIPISAIDFNFSEGKDNLIKRYLINIGKYFPEPIRQLGNQILNR